MILMPDSVELLEIIYNFTLQKSNGVWTNKNDNNTIPIIKHHYIQDIHQNLRESSVYSLQIPFYNCRKLTKHFQPEIFDDSDIATFTFPTSKHGREMISVARGINCI